MKVSVETLYRILEEWWQTIQQNGIPAAMVRDQLPGATLPPGGPSGSGYPPAAHDTAWADVTGTPTTLSGYGITDAASDSELATHEADTTAVHGITDTSTLYRAGGTDVALADGGTGASLADPNADRILFWDDSAGSTAFLTPGTNLTITGTTIDAASGGSPLTVEEVDASPTDSAITKIIFPNGTLSITSHEATYTPAASGSTLTVEEVDASPTDSAVTKIVFPNGTLGIASHVATYTPAASGNNATSTGAAGSEPGSPASGDLYLPNNGFHIERYSGSAWVPWGPIFPMVAPPTSSWSWDNQGSATVTTTNGGITMFAPASGTTETHVYYRTAPATPYTITAALLWAHTVPVDFHQYGICFRQSSTGKLNTFTLGRNASPFIIYSRKWTTTTSFSADYTSYTIYPNSLYFLRITDNGTNRILDWSMNGQTWVTLQTIGRTDFLTADQVGFHVTPLNATYPIAITLLSWAVT
jgi:hypothetical protein